LLQDTFINVFVFWIGRIISKRRRKDKRRILFPKQIYIKSDYFLSTLLASFAGRKVFKNKGGFAHPPSRLSGGLPPQGVQITTLFA
jgi:hypothetical protein